MSGSFRFFLALLVVISHLVGVAGGVNSVIHYGFYAVFVFYIFSGRYISLVLRETYKFNFRAFIGNRFLRLYPQYYFVSALTLIVIAIVGKPVSFELFPHNWQVDGNVVAFLSNLLIIPLPLALPYGIYIWVPQAWSVGVEIVCYGILWLYAARRIPNALVVLLLALIYVEITLLLGESWEARYYPAAAAALPFAIGTLMSWKASIFPTITERLFRIGAGICFGLWLINMIMTGFIAPVGSSAYEALFFINMLLSVGVIYTITDTRMNIIPKTIDQFLSKMSYPVFLSHWIVAYAIRRLFLPDITFGEFGFLLLAVSLPATLMLSYLLVAFQESLVDPIRHQIRNRHYVMRRNRYQSVLSERRP